MPRKKPASSAGKSPPNVNGKLLDLLNDFQVAVAAGQEKSWVAEVNDLLARGANAATKDRHQRTLLHLAAEINDTRLIKRLLAKKLDPNAADKQGETPLHRAASLDNFEAARALLAAGSDPNARRDNGQTPLHDAAGGNTELVKALIAKGADINARNDAGETPLFYAAESMSPDAALLLIKKGAAIDEKNNAGWTPLALAAWNGNEITTRCLIEAGACVTPILDDGNGLLHLAVDTDAPSAHDILDMLVKAGLDPSRRNKAGLTALDMAREQGSSKKIVALLEAAPAVFAAREQSLSKAAHNRNIARLDSLMPRKRRPS